MQKFNNYFSTVVNQYLPESNQAPDFHKLNDFVKSKITEDNVLSIPLPTCDEVQKSLNEVDSHKASGLDGLSSKILKLSASVIANPLTVIFNQSISHGHISLVDLNVFKSRNISRRQLLYLMVYHKEVFSDPSYLSCLLMISIYTRLRT